MAFQNDHGPRGWIRSQFSWAWFWLTARLGRLWRKSCLAGRCYPGERVAEHRPEQKLVGAGPSGGGLLDVVWKERQCQLNLGPESWDARGSHVTDLPERLVPGVGVARRVLVFESPNDGAEPDQLGIRVGGHSCGGVLPIMGAGYGWCRACHQAAQQCSSAHAWAVSGRSDPVMAGHAAPAVWAESGMA